jgi:MFS family permease
MRSTFNHPLSPTSGEKRLLVAALAVGLAGGVIIFAIVTQMGDNKALLRSLTGADLWFVAAGVLGSLCALYIGRDWFGHRGLRGTLKAVAGILSISFMGTIIGGTLALPFYGTMFGPMMFGVTLAAYPVLALIWLNALVAAHLLFMIWRREIWCRERDSSFERLPLSVTVFAARQPTADARQNWLTPKLDRAKRRA